MASTVDSYSHILTGRPRLFWRQIQSSLFTAEFAIPMRILISLSQLLVLAAELVHTVNRLFDFLGLQLPCNWQIFILLVFYALIWCPKMLASLYAEFAEVCNWSLCHPSGPDRQRNPYLWAFLAEPILLLIHPRFLQVRLKNDPTLKMWLLGYAWKFWRQILCTCLAGFCPLTCCFCVQLLYVRYTKLA